MLGSKLLPFSPPNQPYFSDGQTKIYQIHPQSMGVLGWHSMVHKTIF